MKETRTYIPDEELLNDLRRVAAICPNPTMQEYDKHGRYGDLKIRLRFGSYRKALRLAGILSEPPVEQLNCIAGWSEEDCLDYLRKVRWPEGVRCPRCDESIAVKRLANQVHANKALYTYGCNDCDYNFTDFTGSFLHKRSVRMRDWLRMIFLSTHQKYGMELGEQAKMLGIDKGVYTARVQIISSSRLAGELGKKLMEELG